MTIQQQVITLMAMFVLSIPMIIMYLFFPYQHSYYTSEIDIVKTIMFGIVASLAFLFFILNFIILMREFPLLGVPTLGILSYKLYKSWNNIYNTAIDNYKRYHMKEWR